MKTYNKENRATDEAIVKGTLIDYGMAIGTSLLFSAIVIGGMYLASRNDSSRNVNPHTTNGSIEQVVDEDITLDK
ncbi:hypothetical protein GOV12_00190 [Candidatus Pacearchaeota archaeon]|nr:hypothetical protein [Candidatus Pacearchaeota archaeon]